MHKLMCTFMTPMKKTKIPDRNLDTSCPAGIPCNKLYVWRKTDYCYIQVVPYNGSLIACSGLLHESDIFNFFFIFNIRKACCIKGFFSIIK